MLNKKKVNILMFLLFLIIFSFCVYFIHKYYNTNPILENKLNHNVSTLIENKLIYIHEDANANSKYPKNTLGYSVIGKEQGSCVHKKYSKDQVGKYGEEGEGGFKITMESHGINNIVSGRVKSMSTYKGDMMFVINVDEMTYSSKNGTNTGFFAIWLYSSALSQEIDILETTMKTQKDGATSLVSGSPEYTTTQVWHPETGLLQGHINIGDKNKPQQIVLVKKGYNIDVYIDPSNINYTNGVVTRKDDEHHTNYNVSHNQETTKGYIPMGEIKDAEYKLVFNLESRFYDEKNGWEQDSDCKSKNYQNIQPIEFKVKSVKYYDLNNQKNKCCISNDDDACYTKLLKDNKCDHTKCTQGSTNENCCSKNSSYDSHKQKWVCSNP
jgi:hypothetical protein